MTFAAVKQRLEKVERALCVVVLDSRTRSWLLENDPRCLRQACMALIEDDGLAPIVMGGNVLSQPAADIIEGNLDPNLDRMV
jgi:hypothetical protein